ncbi:MAG TPA: hypothetical protein VJ891_01160 [Casimicrobiaceae bacterium]|nr:hypothetical protein [Casimicrobiaceae bacterium]
MRNTAVSIIAVSCFAALASSAVYAVAPSVDGGEDELAPTGKGWGHRVEKGNGDNGQARAGRTKSGGANGISYHGGPVMLPNSKGVPPTVYYIWYGTWGSPATDILNSLAQNIGGSSYFNINTTYFNGSSQHVVKAVGFGGSTTDSYSHGTALSDSGVQSVVASAINSGRLPFDSNGVYFVLTSPDVNETSGFCTQYCGWHTHATISRTDIKFAFVGNPNRCPSACEMQDVGPNGIADATTGLDSGADGMASIISHELEEAVTDPDLNAWYDARGQENADKCAWTFGTTSKAPNGATYNVTLGSGTYSRFLIQRNWVNASGGYCAQSY